MANKQDGQQLTFRVSKDGTTRAFNHDCIVGILREEGKGDESECTLLCVEVADGPEDAKVEERTAFMAVPVYDPPQELVSNYGPDDASFWIGNMAGSYTGASDIHVIISTGSGGQQAQTCYDKLVAPFLDSLGLSKGSSYSVHTTESAETIVELAKSTLLPRASNGDHLSIILLSGDGGIVDLVNGLMSPSRSPLPPTFIRPKVSLIPTGTGNALANSTGVLSDRTLGLSTLYRGRPRPLPIFTVLLSPDSVMLDGSGNEVSADSLLSSHLISSTSRLGITVHGAVVFSFGLHASLVADSDTPEYRKHGAQRFQMAAKDLLFPADGSPSHEYRAKVSLLKRAGAVGGDAEWEAVPRPRHAYVLVTLVAQLEKGFTISPASEPLDGLMRVVHFGEMEKGGEGIMEVMKAAYAGGKHVEDEKVAYEEVKGLKIEFEGDEEDARWRRVCVDGKIFVVGKSGSVVVEKEQSRCLDLMWLDSDTFTKSGCESHFS